MQGRRHLARRRVKKRAGSANESLYDSDRSTILTKYNYSLLYSFPPATDSQTPN